jgi:hypothetical protein
LAKDLANFHRYEAEKAWSSLLRSSNSIDAVIINSLIPYEANLVACIQSLHSMADILDQIICITLSEDPYKPHKEGMVMIDVYLKNLKNFEITHALNRSNILEKNFAKVGTF